MSLFFYATIKIFISLIFFIFYYFLSNFYIFIIFSISNILFPINSFLYHYSYYIIYNSNFHKGRVVLTGVLSFYIQHIFKFRIFIFLIFLFFRFSLISYFHFYFYSIFTNFIFFISRRFASYQQAYHPYYLFCIPIFHIYSTPYLLIFYSLSLQFISPTSQLIIYLFYTLIL